MPRAAVSAVVGALSKRNGLYCAEARSGHLRCVVRWCRYFVMVVSVANTSIVYNAVPSYPLWWALVAIAADNAVCAGMYWSARHHCDGVELCQPMSRPLVTQVPTYFQLVFAVLSGLAVVAHRHVRERCCGPKPSTKPSTLATKLLAAAGAGEASPPTQRSPPSSKAAGGGQAASSPTPVDMPGAHHKGQPHVPGGTASIASSSYYSPVGHYGMQSGDAVPLNNRPHRGSSIASSSRSYRTRQGSSVFASVRSLAHHPSTNAGFDSGLSQSPTSMTLGHRLSQASKMVRAALRSWRRIHHSVSRLAAPHSPVVGACAGGATLNAVDPPLPQRHCPWKRFRIPAFSGERRSQVGVVPAQQRWRRGRA